jgi:lipoprotein-anchoring transpeptidase ErfK/SrfK
MSRVATSGIDHMLNKRVLALCIVAICGMITRSTSAQECGPFFWLCQRPAEPHSQPTLPGAPAEPRVIAPSLERGFEPQYTAIYGPVVGEPFPVPAARLSDIDPSYLRRAVSYPSNQSPGTIVIDPQSRFLYLVQGAGRALRYGIGVGRQGFDWSGVATIGDKQEWPDWYPPREMIQRQPELMRQMTVLRGGLGMAGGPRNPLGARAMYLWQGNKDTLYRIHGTNEPWTIGRSVSSGCIRMLNQDVIDLYQRTPLGAKVVVLSSRRG